MKAPDKIFLLAIPHLPSEKIGEIADEWSEKPFEGLDNLEYIRKEALMEWLEQELAQRQQWFERYEDAEDLHACNDLTKVINKLNEM